VTCGTAYAQVARGGSRGGRVGREGRPYRLSEEATQKTDDAIVGDSLSVDMQLEEDETERKAHPSRDVPRHGCSLHTSTRRRLPILPADAKSIHSPATLSADTVTLKIHNST
jgi:hypothetical protein